MVWREIEDQRLRNQQREYIADFAEKAAGAGFTLVGRRLRDVSILLDAMPSASVDNRRRAVRVERMRSSHSEQQHRHEDRKRAMEHDRH